MLQIDMQTNVTCQNSLKCDIINKCVWCRVKALKKSVLFTVICKYGMHMQVRITFVSHV